VWEDGSREAPSYPIRKHIHVIGGLAILSNVSPASRLASSFVPISRARRRIASSRFAAFLA
jgi:hypothetical protein